MQSFVTPLRISNVKNQDPWKFNRNFWWTPLEIPLPFNLAQEFRYALSSIPLPRKLEIPCSQPPHPPRPPVCLFFWNSPMQFYSSRGFHTSFSNCLSWFQKYWHNTIKHNFGRQPELCDIKKWSEWIMFCSISSATSFILQFSFV